jgi:hypothetical protein
MMSTPMLAPEKPDFATLSLRDGGLLVCWITIIVMWGFALLNMAGFDVSRGRGGGLTASAEHWPVMLGLAVVTSLICIGVMVWRMQFWKNAQTTIAVALHIQPHLGDTNNGYLIKYSYDVGGREHHGKATFGRKSALINVQPGDSFAVFFNPAKPQQSRVLA